MERLIVIHESDIYPERTDIDPKNFHVRSAARAVVINKNNNVALLKANTYNYHKLPGGGVEEGEDMKQALKRELIEEIGCSADVITEVGEIIEFRDEWGLKQTSHCYLVRQTGDQQPPSFTQGEIDDGFEIVWANDIDEAILLIAHDQPQNYDGYFIQRRDTTFLQAAKDLGIINQVNG